MPATTSVSAPLTEHRTARTTYAAVVAWCLLAGTDAIVWWGGAPALLRAIRACPVRRRSGSGLDTEDLLHALRHARVFALHQYHCLKYWAAATCLLRLFGHPASFVIGVTKQPFQSHAWLEYSGGNAGREQERQEGINWVVIFRG
jgi:Transglutaminase-like superfamily